MQALTAIAKGIKGLFTTALKAATKHVGPMIKTEIVILLKGLRIVVVILGEATIQLVAYMVVQVAEQLTREASRRLA